MVPWASHFTSFYLVGLFVKYIDEAFSYDFAFALGLGNACKFAEEFLACVNSYDIQSKTFVVVKHILEFVFAQHSVIDKYAGEIFADGLVEQHSRYR